MHRLSCLATAIRILCLAFAFVCSSGPVFAHGGLSMDDDKCVLRIGNYAMHFAGYLPESVGVKEFCEDIPEAGHTVIVLDAIDESLRSLPIEVKIVKDAGAGNDEAAETVFHLPPKVYPTGSVPLEYKFEKPGKYVGLVTAGAGAQAQKARFPFSVGGGAAAVSRYGVMIGIVAIGALLFLFSEFRSRRSRRDPSEAREHSEKR